MLLSAHELVLGSIYEEKYLLNFNVQVSFYRVSNYGSLRLALMSLEFK